MLRTIAAVLALAGAPIHIGAEGPPSVTRLTAGLQAPSLINDSGVSQTIVFENGLCNVTLAAGAVDTCHHAFWFYAGRYPFIAGGSPALLVVDPAPRTVTLTAASFVRRGRPIALTGTLAYSVYLAFQVPQPIEILARSTGSTRFVRIATVTPTLVDYEHLHWQLLVRPRVTTTYLAVAQWQPTGGVRWQVARSAPATVVVRN